MNSSFLSVWIPVLGLTFLGIEQSRGADAFLAKEGSMRLFGDYLDQPENKWGGGYALDYYASKYVGLGVSSHWQEWHGATIDNVAGEVMLRLPIQSIRLAPYAIGTAGYDFERNRWYEGVGGGVEFRFKKGWGVFGDYQYLFRDEVKDGNFYRFGFRFAI